MTISKKWKYQQSIWNLIAVVLSVYAIWNVTKNVQRSLIVITFSTLNASISKQLC